jgi:hypothetical protein
MNEVGSLLLKAASLGIKGSQAVQVMFVLPGFRWSR